MFVVAMYICCYVINQFAMQMADARNYCVLLGNDVIAMGIPMVAVAM
jgi:hypothetical protein